MFGKKEEKLSQFNYKNKHIETIVIKHNTTIRIYLIKQLTN